jgi:Tol biopolymer transport system component
MRNISLAVCIAIASSGLFICGGCGNTSSPDNGNNSQNLGTLTQITSNNAEDRDPAWAPDGNRIAFTSTRSGNRDIWTIPIDGGATFQITTDTGVDEQPDWSPTEGRIAFSSIPEGWDEYQRYIWTVPENGGTPIRISNYFLDAFYPSYSPDGESIACEEFQGSHFRVAIVPSTGGDSVELIDNARMPDWSPDGSKVAYCASPSNSAKGIFVIPIVGGSSAQLSSLDGSNPSWSPDGTRVAFEAEIEGNWDIYIVSATGGDLNRITTALAEDRDPAWAPDGSKIAFSSYRSGNFDIWTITVE